MTKSVKFIFDSDIIRGGILVEDPSFIGGYKIISDNMILSLSIVKIIEEEKEN